MSRLFAFILLFGIVSANVTFWMAQDPPLASLIENKKTALVAVMNEKYENGKPGSGLGTGFFIAENTIVTNNHVIDNSTKLEVMTVNGPKRYTVKIKWTDTTADIAVLELVDWEKFKKENSNITYLKFNTSYKQGDKVIVLGNPSGLMFSASLGIVSQDKQKLSANPQFYIGSDAHIYPGNSGGPMLDKYGDILGVSNLMLPTDGGSYGFGIPASIVQKVLSDFGKYNEVRWPVIGITMEGNKITDIAPGSAGGKAGLKVGDVVSYIIIDNFKHKVQVATDITNELAQMDYQSVVRFMINDNKEIDVAPGYKTSKDFATIK